MRCGARSSHLLLLFLSLRRASSVAAPGSATAPALLTRRFFAFFPNEHKTCGRRSNYVWCCGLVSLLSSASGSAIYGTNLSLPLGRSVDHLIIQHMPKTGGTSFRRMIFQDAERHRITCQILYSGKVSGRDDFNAEHPAQVKMGHLATFHTLQPVEPGHTVRYTTMLRSPLSWALCASSFTCILRSTM